MLELLFNTHHSNPINMSKSSLLRFFCSILTVSMFGIMLIIGYGASAQIISPMQYGLREADNPEEVYRVLLRAHEAAESVGGRVTYDGIDTLRLAIPEDGRSIPLQEVNDFGGVVLEVTNTSRNLFLFSRIHKTEPITFDDTALLCRAIDNGDFRGVATLGKGRWLLHVVDSTLWVDNRRDHTYGHYREDIMLIEDGFSLERPAMPYSSGGSHPSIFARRLDVEGDTFFFGNITLLRDSSSTRATYLMQLENHPSAMLQNIVVVTPYSEILAGNDAIIRIYNTTNVMIDSLSIWGTYSRKNHSGYGVLLGNLNKTHIRRLKSLTEWGVFGTNNMTETFIEYSDFNRFDIHCYGRDVTFEHCIQRDGFNQFSSVVGTIAFRHCTFDDFTPVLIEDSYNAYSHFLLSIDSCQWWPSEKHRAVFDGGRIDSPLNRRKELQNPSLPDFSINEFEINTSNGIRKLELIHLRGNEQRAHQIGGLEQVTLRGVRIVGNPRAKLVLSNKRVRLVGEAKIETPASKQGLKTLTRIGRSKLKM